MSFAKRPVLLVTAAVITAAIIVGVIATVRDDGSGQTKTTPVSFTAFNPAGPTLVKTNEAPLWNTPQQLAFRNTNDWAAKDLPFDSLRSVDFGKSMIVAYAPGQQPTGGYTTTITGITGDEKKLVVSVLDTAPGANCATSQALTAPKAMAELPTSSAEVVFDVKKETRDC